MTYTQDERDAIGAIMMLSGVPSAPQAKTTCLVVRPQEDPPACRKRRLEAEVRRMDMGGALKRSKLGRGGGKTPSEDALKVKKLRQWAAGIAGGRKTGEGIVPDGEDKPVVQWRLTKSAVKFSSRFHKIVGLQQEKVKMLEATDAYEAEDDLLQEMPDGIELSNHYTMRAEVREAAIPALKMDAATLEKFHDKDTCEDVKIRLFRKAQRKFNQALNELGINQRKVKRARGNDIIHTAKTFVEYMRNGGTKEYVLGRTCWNFQAGASSIFGGKNGITSEKDMILVDKFNAGNLKLCDLMATMDGSMP